MHDVAKSDAVLLEKRITNYTQRTFLEAIHSVINQDTVNEHAEISSCYLPLINSIKQNNMHYKNNSVLTNYPHCSDECLQFVAENLAAFRFLINFIQAPL